MAIFVVLWGVLALVVLVLAIYRNLLGIHEGALHISGVTASLGDHELRQLRREDKIERWGEPLTVVVFLYGLFLASVYLYEIS